MTVEDAFAAWRLANPATAGWPLDAFKAGWAAREALAAREAAMPVDWRAMALESARVPVRAKAAELNAPQIWTDEAQRLTPELMRTVLERAPPGSAEWATFSRPDIWMRLGEVLPGVGQPILLAKWDADGFWRVRDAALCIRDEDVRPCIADMSDGFPQKWWFDHIYPGRHDVRLAKADMLWTPMREPQCGTCGAVLITGPSGSVDCIACNPDPARR